MTQFLYEHPGLGFLLVILLSVLSAMLLGGFLILIKKVVNP